MHKISSIACAAAVPDRVIEAASPGNTADVGPNTTRRRLVAATGVTGAMGIVAASVPFVISMSPSERARAGSSPVDIDAANMAAGNQLISEWRGKPVLVLRRTDAMIQVLQTAAHRERLADPDSKVASQQPSYARNMLRSLEPEYLVLVSVCTHLGCVPTFRPEIAAPGLGSEWPGGYFCPCHGSKFDFAGRVYRNVPAPTNLVVPPHRYLASSTIRIGEELGGST